MNSNNKTTIMLITSSLVLVLLITIGLSFAYFTANIEGEEAGETITVTGGRMKIIYDTNDRDINITNAVPKDGVIATKEFTLTGDSTTNQDMLYQIHLVIENNGFTDGALKYKLISTNTDDNGEVAPSITELKGIPTGINQEVFIGNAIFESPTENKVHSYTLEFYFPRGEVPENENQGKTLEAYVSVREGKYVIPGFNYEKGVNHPALATGMTPVIWNGSSFVPTTEDDPDWYDYSTKKWANAITADDSFWVWIPRYAYKITSGFHQSTTGTIDVKFMQGTTNISSDSTTIYNSGYEVEVNDTSANYFLHPSFQIGKEELGFWVAKYEATAAEGVASGSVSCNSGDNVNTKTVKIIPNVTSWRCINIKNSYEVSFNMRNKTGTYGWQTGEVDTHMMTNQEWGSVAYLSKSQYGADEEVWNNSYNQYRTGCSGTGVDASNETSCVAYNTVNGQKASTTHNVYGVYDMSGGAWDRVMGNYNGISVSSGFDENEINLIDEKHLTRYFTDPLDLCNGTSMCYDLPMYGDAVYETSSDLTGDNSWYGDRSVIPSVSAPWFDRGGYFNNSANAGVFVFYSNNGNANVYHSFRPVFALRN